MFVLGQAHAQEAPSYAISTVNLLTNGDFGNGVDGWTSLGDGLTASTPGTGLVLRLKPPQDLTTRNRYWIQTVGPVVSEDHTLYLRFTARNTVRFTVSVREKDAPAHLIFTRTLAPMAPTDKPKNYAFAFQTSQDWGAESLELVFSFFCDDEGVFSTNKVELLDEDDADPASLPQTEMPHATIAPALPALTPIAPPAAPADATPAPRITEKVNLRRQPAPDASTGIALIQNGDFSQGDAGWKAWGKNVGAHINNGWLDLRLTTQPGDKPDSAGLAQPLMQAVSRGDRIAVRLKAKGNARFAVRLQAAGDPTHTLLAESVQAGPTEDNLVYVATADQDYAAGQLGLVIHLAYDFGQLSLTQFSVYKSSATPVAPVYQIRSGGSDAGTFSADAFYTGGFSASMPDPDATIDTSAPNTGPEDMYRSERAGIFSYHIPKLVPGADYTVRLHFAECYWDAAGKRQFNVTINGNRVLTNYDIYVEAGNASKKAVTRDIDVTADSSGQINIDFTRGAADQPKLSGLEILAAGN